MYEKLGLSWEYAPMDCVTADEARVSRCPRFHEHQHHHAVQALAYDAATVRAATAKLARGSNT